jgi:hypothetical protein
LGVVANKCKRVLSVKQSLSEVGSFGESDDRQLGSVSMRVSDKL